MTAGHMKVWVLRVVVGCWFSFCGAEWLGTKRARTCSTALTVIRRGAPKRGCVYGALVLSRQPSIAGLLAVLLGGAFHSNGD